MPLTRISLRRGKPAAYRTAVAESIYQAMRDTFEVPEDDKFMIVTEHDGGDFIYGAAYMDIARSDDLIIMQITVSNTRSLEQKKALFKCITERLAQSPGVRPKDVFVNLLEVAEEDWSFGNGVAQYA
jgi:4-oxalocrotonate tautomerase